MSKAIFAAHLMIAFSLAAGAGDLWFSAADPGVTTRNDCAVVQGLDGSPRVRRTYQSSDDPGVELSLYDKLQAGDEILSGPDERAELTSGRNILLLVGPGTSVRFLGLRAVETGNGGILSRLDLELSKGDLRAQARLNTARPETVFVDTPGMDAMLERGDCGIGVDGSWRLAAADGQVFCRLRGAGAPFTLEAGRMLDPEGTRTLAGEELAAFKSRLPFSHEVRRAALPPNPPPDPEAEAP